MSNVIDLFSEREKRKAEPAHDEFQFTVDVYANTEGDVSGKLFNVEIFDGVSDADRFRMMATRLEALAVICHDKATHLEPDEDGFTLARIKVFESSRVRAWYSDKIEGAESIQWMERRLDDAKSIIAPPA
jgi:hypothetical protein